MNNPVRQWFVSATTVSLIVAMLTTVALTSETAAALVSDDSTVQFGETVDLDQAIGMTEFEPEGPFDDGRERSQEAINAELAAFAKMEPAFEAMEAIEPNEYAYIENYAGGAVDVWTQTLTIWWRGEFPPEMRSRMKMAAPGVTLAVLEAPFDRRTLSHALRRAQETGYLDQFQIDYTVLREDGTGIVVVSYGREKVLPNADRLSELFGIPVIPVIVDGTPPADAASLRVNDSSPRKGNASIQTRPTATTTSACTTAFTIRRQVGSVVSRRLLSASHCDKGYGFNQVNLSRTNYSDGSPNSVHHTPAGQTLPIREIDTRIMNSTGTGTGTMTGWIYVGAWNSTSDTAKPVHQGWPWAMTYWQPVMIGGRTTGDRFGRVTNSAAETRCDSTGEWCPVVAAGNPDEATLVSGGDSGGPAYAVTSQNTLIAHGITIQDGGSANTVPCDGPRHPVADNCNMIALFVPLGHVMDVINERTTGANTPQWVIDTP